MSPAQKRCHEAIRKYAAGFPDAREEFPHGCSTFKIGTKGFVALRMKEDDLLVTVKLPGSGEAALRLPFAAPTYGGLGKYGYVTATFAPDADIPLNLLYEWIDESYAALAKRR